MFLYFYSNIFPCFFIYLFIYCHYRTLNSYFIQWIIVSHCTRFNCFLPGNKWHGSFFPVLIDNLDIFLYEVPVNPLCHFYMFVIRLFAFLCVGVFIFTYIQLIYIRSFIYMHILYTFSRYSIRYMHHYEEEI